jgi:membrane-associated phospholipid phosphatase
MPRRWLLLLALLICVFAGPRLAGAAGAVESSGDILRVALPLAAWGMTFQRDDQPGRLQFYKAFGTTVAGTLLLKSVIDKERPDDDGDDDAFPSGHAATAFSGASFIQRRYGWRVGAPAYVVAGYVGWTRIDADKHDGWDVLAGAALATALTHAFVTPRNNNVEVTAVVAADGWYFGLTARW